MSITVGNIIAGNNADITIPTKEFLVVAKNFEELNITKPTEFCFGVTTDDKKLYYWMDNIWNERTKEI